MRWAWGPRLVAPSERASFAMLRYITETLLGAGQSLIVEANFRADQDAPFY